MEELLLKMQLQKFNKFKSLIFKSTKQVIALYTMNKCKIDSIEDLNGKYFIGFYYVGKRQIFVKSAIEIHKNSYLIKEFTPSEAALIGIYAALSYNNISKRSKEI